MKTVVCNFASGGWYPKGQERLRLSLEAVGYVGDMFRCQDPELIGAPLHSAVPYAFKPYMLVECAKRGYDIAIYADASVFAVRSWDPVFAAIARDGYYFEAAGHWLGNWTKDSVLNRFGVSRDAAMTIPLYTAGFTCLNLRNDTACEFLKRWYDAARDGDSFQGPWKNTDKSCSSDPRCHGHRHDMSVGSLIAHELGMKLAPGGQFLAYVGPEYGTPQPTVVAHLQPC